MLNVSKNNPMFKYKCFDATLQFHCFTVVESKYWVSLFEKTNRLSFDCMVTQSQQEYDANSSNVSSSIVLLTYEHARLSTTICSYMTVFASHSSSTNAQ